MGAAIDDLHVVDADHRQATVAAIEIRPALKIADHDLWLELPHQAKPGFDVVGQADVEALQVGQEGLALLHFVLAVDQLQAMDPTHLRELFGEQVVGSTADDDLHLMATCQQVPQHDP